jgi:hypothetical protein
MAFRVIANPVFKATATIIFPGEDEPVSQDVEVKFRYAEMEENLTGEEFLRRVVVEMLDLVDDAGKPVAFEDVRDVLFKMPPVQVGLGLAYWKSFQDSRVKN